MEGPKQGGQCYGRANARGRCYGRANARVQCYGRAKARGLVLWKGRYQVEERRHNVELHRRVA